MSLWGGGAGKGGSCPENGAWTTLSTFRVCGGRSLSLAKSSPSNVIQWALTRPLRKLKGEGRWEAGKGEGAKLSPSWGSPPPSLFLKQ